MSRRLSEAQRRHLLELLAAPYWRPNGSGEWACAHALERRGYVVRDFSNMGRGSVMELTPVGRKAGEDLQREHFAP